MEELDNITSRDFVQVLGSDSSSPLQANFLKPY